MTQPSSRVKLTYDDFLLFPDDGQRHELIDGEHYVTPSPNIKHQIVRAGKPPFPHPQLARTQQSGSRLHRAIGRGVYAI
jgi:hypothetical protein